MKRWTFRKKLTQSHFFSTPISSLSSSLSLSLSLSLSSEEAFAGNSHCTPLGKLRTQQRPFLKEHKFPIPKHMPVNDRSITVIGPGSGNGSTRTAMLSDGGGVFNLAEIWPGFQMNASATSYGLALDPMVMDQRSNHISRKHRDKNDFSKGGTSTSNGNDNNHANFMDMNESEGKCQKADENSENKIEGELGNPGKATEHSAKPAELPKQDFIHVRARRGQATDSHSLAERARREKISERMKILQDLVPGCNKVIGKALVLDEIINYIQSLQRQVEFLSLKLETVNARGVYGYPSKDFAQQSFDDPGMQFGSQSSREYVRGASPEWLHMQLGGGFERSS